MQLWTRELFGWILMGLGVYVLFRALLLLTAGNQFMLEGGTVTVIGVVLFRGGIHLLKIAVAARICLEDINPQGNSKPAIRNPKEFQTSRS
jgi:hypothetical protein